MVITSISTSDSLGDHRHPSSTTYKTHKDLTLRSSGVRPPQREIANAGELTLTPRRRAGLTVQAGGLTVTAGARRRASRLRRWQRHQPTQKAVCEALSRQSGIGDCLPRLTRQRGWRWTQACRTLAKSATGMT